MTKERCKHICIVKIRFSNMMYKRGICGCISSDTYVVVVADLIEQLNGEVRRLTEEARRLREEVSEYRRRESEGMNANMLEQLNINQFQETDYSFE